MAWVVAGTKAWQRYLVGGMIAVALYFALPGGGLAQGFTSSASTSPRWWRSWPGSA